MPTLGDAARAASSVLTAAGSPDPVTDARILLLAAADLDRMALVRDPDRPLDPAAAIRLDGWVARRAAGEPVSRILGRRAFWDLTLHVTPDVLDPRPDTETLVEAVLQAVAWRRGTALRVLDLGTGSGAILCALLSELPNAIGWAVDRSARACAVAGRNLADHGLARRGAVACGDWAAALADGAFDVVASNPPYIETAVIPRLDRDVREHDPHLALDGGADGLDCFRVLAADLPRLLLPGGVAAFEVGLGQDGAVQGLLATAGLAGVRTLRDLSGIGRVVLAEAPPFPRALP